MSSPADIIRQLLLDLDLGTADADWPIYIGFLPGTPDNAICVYDTAGKPDGRLMATGEQVVHPGIQVMVRGLPYPTVWDKITGIAVVLDAQQRTSVVIDSETSYILANVSRTGDVLTLGVEAEGDRRRHIFTLNAVVTLIQSS